MKEIIESNSFFDIIRQVVTDGVIVEIGAGTGETTIELLKIAKEKGTKVIVIDPFDNNCPESYRYSLELFNQKVDSYKEWLTFLRINSLSSEAEVFLSGLKIDFSFIDGLQFKGAVLNDLRICSHAKVICLDDYDRESDVSQVPEAVNEFAEELVIDTVEFSTPLKQLIIKSRHAYLI